jgi:hypothetical protein
MHIQYPGFGSIVVDGTTYDHDVVIDGGAIRARTKEPSRQHKAKYGHTPLSAAEDIPWSSERVIIGTGAAGRLPIMDEVRDQAAARGVELVTMPTAQACELLATVAPQDVCAILHVTC